MTLDARSQKEFLYLFFGHRFRLRSSPKICREDDKFALTCHLEFGQ
jgi:hypothetical protein